MKTQQIEVTIEPDGSVSIHVQGVDGMQCLALTKELELALGGQVIERKLTAEAYPAHQATNRLSTRRTSPKKG